MPQLHETGYGRKLLESDLPRAIVALEKIAKELEKLNENITRLQENSLLKNLMEYAKPLTPEEAEEMEKSISSLYESLGINLFNDSTKECIPDGGSMPFE